MHYTKTGFLLGKTGAGLLLVGWAAVASAQEPVPAGGSATSRTGPISGYMDFHVNDAQHADPVLDFHRFVLLFTHSFSERVRFVSELELEHAVVSPETDGELELEQALRRLSDRPFVQSAGGHGAGAGRGHQRTSRAARVQRRRAPIRRHRPHSDDLVRGRSRRARGTARRVALPRLRDGDARRVAVQRRGGVARRAGRRAPRPTGATSPVPPGWSTSGRRAWCWGRACGAATPDSRFPAGIRASP